MKERPILFSGAMVEAILAGTKTMTRRLVKLDGATPDAAGFEVSDAAPTAWLGCDTDGTSIMVRCPYGAPGDRLWVRETMRRRGAVWTYAAGGAEVSLPAGDPRIPAMLSWAHHKDGDTCVSIHMPRWASRIDLEVTSVRVERLNDITGPDILAEGAVARPHRDDVLGMCPVSAFDGKAYVDLLSLWAAGWDAINGERAPWASNPWVWVVSFRRVRP